MKRIFIKFLLVVGLVGGIINNIEAQISTEPVNDTICLGDDAEFIVVVNNSADTSYQWQSLKGSNWLDLSDNEVYSGVDNDTLQLIIPSITYNDSLYRCIVTQGINDTSNEVKSVIYSTLSTNVSADQEICSGDTPDELSSGPSGGPTGSPEYLFQWQDSIPPDGSWADIPNDTLENYQPGPLNETTYFRVILNNDIGCTEHISDMIEVTVYDALSTSVSDDQEICSGDTPNGLSSNPDGGPTIVPGYLFQWQDSIPPDGNWADIPNDTLETYQPGPLNETTFFRVILNNDIGCTEHISDMIEVTVYDALSTSVSADQEICSGDTPDELSSGPDGGPPGNPEYLFQWQDSIPNGNWANLPGDTLETYQPGSLYETTFFRVILNNAIGCTEHISDPIQVTVYGALSTNVSDDQEICSGDTPDELSSGPDGGPIGNPEYLFQWQDSVPNGNWANLPNDTLENYQPGPLYETTFFRVILNNEFGCTEHISDPINIVVIPSVTATISISVSKNPTCDNEMVIFTISDTLNGGNSPDFEWFLNGESKSTEDSWSSLVSDNDEVYAQMTSKAECLNDNPVNSDPITMMVNASPVLLNSGNLVPKPLNNPVVLICVDSLESHNYRWFENGVEIPSANEQFYYPRKYDLTFNYNSEYHVMIENEFCFSNSNPYIYAFDKSALFEESEVFIIYPNPNNGNFSLDLNEEVIPEDFESCTVRILDVMGKIVFKEEIFDMAQNIELLDIQNGLYFVEVMISGSQRQVRKLIID